MAGIKWGSIGPKFRRDKVIIVGSGSSLEGFDFSKLSGLGYVITINDSVRSLPALADMWFTLDPWGIHGPQLPPKPFNGTKVAGAPQDFGRPDARNPSHARAGRPDFLYLQRLISHNFSDKSSETAYVLGLSEDPRCVSTGNSGYGAFNVAYHMHPKKILLLGIDGTVGYFYTKSKRNRPLDTLPLLFESTLPQIKRRKIEVINGSPESRITCFSRYTIEEALEAFNAD